MTVLVIFLFRACSIHMGTPPGTTGKTPSGATGAAIAGTAPAASPETTMRTSPEPAAGTTVETSDRHERYEQTEGQRMQEGQEGQNGQDRSVRRQNALPSRIGRRLTVTATAYTKSDAGGEVTYTGTTVTPWHTIAVDPRYILLGSWVYIPYFKDAPNEGWFHAEDVGGAVKGNRIDIYMESREDALKFGLRELEIMVTKALPDRGSR